MSLLINYGEPLCGRRAIQPEMKGFEITEVADGALYLEKMQAGGFNAVVLDMLMPVFDGAHFLSAAHEKLHGDHPITILSATNMAAIEKEKGS